MFTFTKIPAPTILPTKPIPVSVSLKDVYTLGRSLLDMHGLKDWTFDFDRSVRRYGVCNYTKKRISVSYKLAAINPLEQTRDTILHEIAHVLTPRHKHNHVWRAKCLEIGAKPERCYSAREVAAPPKAFVGRCANPCCRLEIKRHRRRDLICRACRLPVIWRQNNG